MKKLFLALALGLFAVSATASAATYDLALGWKAGVTGSANVEFSTVQTIGEYGSVMQTTTDTTGKASTFYDVSSYTLGQLTYAQSSISFSYFRDVSSDVNELLAPVFELTVLGDDSDTYVISWENQNNGGGTVNEGTWTGTGNIAGGYWVATNIDDDTTSSAMTLSALLSNTTDDINLSYDSQLLSYGVSLGDDWDGTYLGYVDFIDITFYGSSSSTGGSSTEKHILEIDFKATDFVEVPEPTGAALFALAAIGVLFMRKRNA